MIHWLTQSAHSHEDLAIGLIPEGLLTATEVTTFNRLKSDKRRKDWLLGRWTAKHLIQSVFPGEITLDQIEILSEDHGAPAVNIRYPSDTQYTIPNTPYLNPTISISHSHYYALCALVERPGVPLGADIERIAPRSDEFLGDYFVPEEIGLVNTAPGQAREGIATAIWSAKESALKAIRLGFTVEPFVVKCLPQGDGQEDWAPVLIEWDQQKLRRAAPALNGWWRKQAGFVMTIAAGAGESVNRV